jgi:hypothetical protein
MEGILPSFYIFNGDPIKHDYNTNWRTWTCMHGFIKQGMTLTEKWPFCNWSM